MSDFDFQQWIKRLEKEASAHPKWYVTKVMLLLSSGFGYLLIMFALLISLLVMTVTLFFKNPWNAIKLGLITVPLIFMMIKAFYIKLDAPEGTPITESEAPELFKELKIMQEQLKSLQIHHVLLVDEYNCFVSQIPRYGVLGGYDNYLVLGLPLMYSVSKDAFRSILAHELGHLSKSHSRFHGWIYRLRATWGRLMHQLKEQDQFGTFLFKHFVRWFGPRMQAYTFVLARQNEYEADRIARALTTKEAIGEGLCQLHIYSQHMDDYFWDPLIQKTHIQPEPPNAFSEMRTYFSASIEGETAQTLLAEAMNEETGVADTHPSLTDRLRSIGVEPRVPKPVSSSAARYYLGAQEEKYTVLLDEQWKTRVANQWKQDYDAVMEKREQLAKYKTRDVEELTSHQFFDYAKLTELLEGEREALLLYEQLLQKDPSYVSAYVATGILTLKLDIQEQFVTAIERLKKAMEMDHEYTITCCRVLKDYFQQKGDSERVEYYDQLRDRYVEQHEGDQEERSDCSLRDTYIPHELPVYVISRLRTALFDHPRVKEAYLLRKQVKFFPERPMYVLLIRFGIPLEKEETPFCRKMIQEILEMDEVPEGTFVVPLNLEMHLRKLIETAGSHPAGNLVVPISAGQKYSPNRFFQKLLTNRLFNGINANDLEMVRHAIHKGANLHSPRNSMTPMMYAAHEGRIEIMEMLLQAGADINGLNYDGNIPLFFASINRQLDAIDWMLAHGADPNIRFNSGRSVLSAVCMHGHHDVLRKLLDAGAKPIFTCHDNQETPLMIATYNDRIACVEMLIESGADLNARSKDGNTALKYAEEYGREAIAVLLRSRSAIV